MSLLSGEALEMPGLCFNRLTDLVCYVWMLPQSIRSAKPETVTPLTDLVSYGLAMSDFDYDNGTWNSSSGNYDDWANSFEFGIEQTVADVINIYVFPLLLVLGTVGNLLSVIVLARLSRHVFSTCVYLALLGVTDLAILYVRCGNDWLKKASDLDLTNMLMVTSQSLCQVYPFCFSFIFHLSKWLIVCLAVEGFIATKYPERVLHMCTLSRAKAVILLLTVLLICINIHYFWSFKLVDYKEYEQENGFCCKFATHGHQYSEGFQEIVWPIMDLLIAEVFPYCVMVFCGATMFVQIVTGRHRGQKEHQEWRERYQLNPGAMDELKVTLLVVCVCCLLLTLPKFSYLVFRYMTEMHDAIPYTFDFDNQQILDLAHAVCSMLEYCFFSCKFLIYFATSRMFRLEYCKLFRQCFCKCRSQSFPADSEASGKPLMA